MKLDLHTHTLFSHDACTSLGAYVRSAQRHGLGCVAVTDHNRLDGALALRERAPFPVIVGEEVKTALGDVIGLFLKRCIPAGMSVLDTISAIKDQDGIVYIPHPSWTPKHGRATVAIHMDEAGLWPLADGIEVLNGRTLEVQPSVQAQERARTHGLFTGAGSDAHTPFDLGRAYVEVEPFDSPQTFMEAMRRASCFGRSGTRRHRVVFNRFIRKSARYLLSTGAA